MKHWWLVLALAAGMSACERGGPGGSELTYPQATRGNVTDDYHGTPVADPYRWMEAAASPEVEQWVASQNELARPYLESIPERKEIIERMTALWDYERIGVPSRHGERYFFLYNDGSSDHSELRVSATPASGGEVVIDPADFSEDSTIAMSDFAVSPNGEFVAYARSDGGTDWDTWRIRNVATGEDLPEVLAGTKFTDASWLPDASGFYYSRYPEDGNGGYDDQQQVSVYFHVLGTPQTDDTLVYSVTDHPTRNPYAEVSADGRHLIITQFDGYASNAVYRMDLSELSAGVTALFDAWDGLYYYLGNAGDDLYFRTTAGAGRGRVIRIDAGTTGEPSEVVPEIDAALDAAALVGDEIVVSYLRDVTSVLQRYGTDGEFRGDVELPDRGTVTGLDSTPAADELHFGFETFTAPPAVLSLSFDSGEVGVVRAPDVDLDSDRFVTEQVFFNSADGTLVPMFVIQAKGI